MGRALSTKRAALRELVQIDHRAVKRVVQIWLGVSEALVRGEELLNVVNQTEANQKAGLGPSAEADRTIAEMRADFARHSARVEELRAFESSTASYTEEQRARMGLPPASIPPR